MYENTKGCGTLTPELPIMNNPNFFAKHGISLELAERMGLEPSYHRDSKFFDGFKVKNAKPFESKIKSVKAWDNEVAKYRTIKTESDRIKIAYLKEQEDNRKENPLF